MFKKKHAAAHDFELNLTPIIDCFVTLICFMLLSATYVNLVGMDAKVPVAVPASSAEAKKEPKFKLELNVKNAGLELLVSGAAGGLNGRKFWPAHKTSIDGSRFDLKALHAELVRIKHQHPKEFSLHFNAGVDMPYEELVRFMDTTRNLAPADGSFAFTDERNGQPVKVDLLFPDFVIAGLAAPEGK